MERTLWSTGGRCTRRSCQRMSCKCNGDQSVARECRAGLSATGLYGRALGQGIRSNAIIPVGGRARGKGASGPLFQSEGGYQGFCCLFPYALDFHELGGGYGPLDWDEAEVIVDGLGLFRADVGE